MSTLHSAEHADAEPGRRRIRHVARDSLAAAAVSLAGSVGAAVLLLALTRLLG